MRLDPGLANAAGSLEGATPLGTRRLLRDLVAVGLMQEEHPSALERLESKLGGTLAGALSLSLRVHESNQGLRPRRVA